MKVSKETNVGYALIFSIMLGLCIWGKLDYWSLLYPIFAYLLLLASCIEIDKRHALKTLEDEIKRLQKELK